MRYLLAVAAASIFCAASVHAAGHAFNENFSVLTPDGSSREASAAFAREVLIRAEAYRKQIAIEWLGAELPRGVGRTFINVHFSESEDKGLTWAVDDSRRTEHTLYLSTSPDRALGSTLNHEMVHAVLATRFPNRLPAWLEEGIASRYDDARRANRREEILRWFQQTKSWPHLRRVLFAENVPATDQTGYALAASLTEFLLSRGDKPTLLTFGQAAAEGGIERALTTHYQIGSLDELQQQWQQWLRTQSLRLAHR